MFGSIRFTFHVFTSYIYELGVNLFCVLIFFSPENMTTELGGVQVS